METGRFVQKRGEATILRGHLWRTLIKQRFSMTLRAQGTWARGGVSTGGETLLSLAEVLELSEEPATLWGSPTTFPDQITVPVRAAVGIGERTVPPVSSRATGQRHPDARCDTPPRRRLALTTAPSGLKVWYICVSPRGRRQ